MATRLYTRSPRWVSVTGNVGDDITCELYIWNEPSSAPVTPTLTLSKPIPSTLQTTVYFNISDYVREYINHTSFTQTSTQDDAPDGEYCYCNVTTKINGASAVNYNFICLNGYGYFEDSYNPQFNQWLLDENTYYVIEGDTGGNFYLHNNGTSNLEVRYSDLDGTNTTALPATGDFRIFPYVHPSYTTDGNILTVFNTATSQTVATYRFEVQCEPKYSPVECDFVNKYGVWQRLIFFKAKEENIEIRNTEYKMLPDSPSYSTSVGYKKPFNVNGNEWVVVNTGFVPEATSEAIKQLMLSEVILIDGKPAKLRGKNTKLFTHINDKLINYRMEFDYANDVINNIM